MTLLLIIAAMGAVLGLSAEVWHTAAQREKERELLFVGNQFRKAIGAYYLSHAKTYPPCLEKLLDDSSTCLETSLKDSSKSPKRYLRRIYRDPITGKDQWGLVKRTDGGIVGVHSLSEDAPIKIAGFELANSSFDGAVKYSDWIFAYSPLPQSRPQASNILPVEGKGLVGQ